MKRLWILFLLIYLWGCNIKRDCHSEYPKMTVVQRQLMPFKTNQTIYYNGSNYFIKCTLIKDTTIFSDMYDQSEECKCENNYHSSNFYGIVAYFISNIPIDPLNSISSMKIFFINGSLNGGNFNLNIYTSNKMSESYSAGNRFTNNSYVLNFNSIYDEEEKSVYYDTFVINNKTYHAVNKVYKTKSFMDTIFYNYEVGFLKLDINNKEYIIQN